MNKELLEHAKNHLSIQQITIAKSGFEMFYDPSDSDMSLIQFQSYKYTKSMDVYDYLNGQKSVIYRYALGLRACLALNEQSEVDQSFEANQAQDSVMFKTLYEIEAEYDVPYLYVEEIAEECLEEFGKFNVGFHVWPFWREYVQSTASRMGVTPPSIGFYEH